MVNWLKPDRIDRCEEAGRTTGQQFACSGYDNALVGRQFWERM
jgi:hypothetical protein